LNKKIKRRKKMKKAIKLAAVAAMMIMLAAPAYCWNWPWMQKAGNKLTTSGSTTVLPIAQAEAEAFMKVNKEADITVSGGGSGVGIAALIDSSTDVANASRSIKSKEIVLAKQKGVNPVGTIIANDGIAIVVNNGNKATSLTLSQLKSIYSGEITKWSQVGGSDDTIVVISRDSASGTFEVFNELVLKGAKLRTDSLMQASNKEIAETVAKTPGAIGYVGLGYLSADLKALSIDGVIPSEATVLNGTYKLARPLYMYTNGEPSATAKSFIDFILSAQGQQIVKATGFVVIK
jgi:phosphate transport system substrate-binding protein